MGIFDKARDALQDHADKVEPVVDRLADEVDGRTGGKHSANIDRGAELAKDQLREQARRDPAAEPGQPV